MGSFRRRLARSCVVPALVVLGVLAGAGSPPVDAAVDHHASAPVITLLSPANGATVVSSATQFVTFSWQITWDVPENTTLSFETASDPAFTQNVSLDNHLCPSTNVNCWATVQPRSVWAPPYGHVWYWRVGASTSSGTVYSATGTFSAVNPPPPPKPADRDNDGVADGADNCPRTANPTQVDSNHDHVGDACQPDHVRPKLRVPNGYARRGKTFFATFAAGDDRGSIRQHVTLAYEGHLVMNEHFGWQPAYVGRGHTFYSVGPLPLAFPIGFYTFCVTVWDRAGNHAKGCARYTIS